MERDGRTGDFYIYFLVTLSLLLMMLLLLLLMLVMLLLLMMLLFLLMMLLLFFPKVALQSTLYTATVTIPNWTGFQRPRRPR